MKTRVKTVRFIRQRPRQEITVRFKLAPGEEAEELLCLIQQRLDYPLTELELDEQTLQQLDYLQIRRLWELLRLSIADLRERGLSPKAIRQIKKALDRFSRITLSRGPRDDPAAIFGRLAK